MRLVERYWWAALGALVVLAIAGLAFGPRGMVAVQTATNPEEACSPSPCAAPDGFEADVLGARVGSGIATITVGFRNHTAPGFGAGDYRPTLPSDFQLQLAGGARQAPVYSPGACPNWGELHVVRGQAAGPEPLCFQATTLAGAELVWAPDLGVLFREVLVPLG